ncbi:MAG: type III PLP-dependent enzyme [Methyloceanibacter sp.]|uniref:type III PLP-dependent enzyme n=1 Tax=Methyloceanibacter sp. TaxID=1965321 RepID=UPI001DC4B305|nr:type III PLP-dependent enzyme [Methyloceanibacter sp.]MCB1442666.1 type III PLP-dependent enzyme [Methyloceanibacter sp.]
MNIYPSASEFLRHRRPERPVLALRPHAAKRAADWFVANFPGRVLYAAKANDAPAILDMLAGAGVRAFDVASLAEIERVARIEDAELYYMNPVKPRGAIARAYREFGVRRFAFDSDDELDKVLQETGGAGDLTLFLRIACPNTHSLIPLEGKYGVSVEDAPALLLRARQCATRLGITFHVGSQAVVPAAFGDALTQVGQLIVSSGVLVDAIDIGGGFPARYPHSDPPGLDCYMDEIVRAADALAVKHSCELLCEPGRALVAESEAVIVRVDARRGNALYINDGAFGSLFDAAFSGFRFPVRCVTPGREVSGTAETDFVLYGPTCDSADYLPGPFVLPDSVGEGDYLEIGQVGAYGRVLANRFNGFGEFDEIVLTDEPMLSMFACPEAAAQRPVRSASL